MKRILAIGAHPDDLEFGCGGVLLKARDEGAQIWIVVFSQGESGSSGDRETRISEAEKAAAFLGVELRWLLLDGDAQLKASRSNVVKVAALIRELKPHLIFAPSGHANQHPDHRYAALIARDANRLSRYGGLDRLRTLEPWREGKVAFYDITSQGGTPEEGSRIGVDVSDFGDRWRELMSFHLSQMARLEYVELQLSRARQYGILYGCELVQMLYLESPPVFEHVDDLSSVKGGIF